MMLLSQAVRSVKSFAKNWLYLSACLLVTVSCEQESVTRHQKPLVELHSPTELTRAIYSAHIQLDPHFVKAIADAAPIRDLLLGLMMFNPQGEVVPAIGREFFSEDGKNWLIILDEKAKWSNGEPVTAQDFVASWQRLADPANASPLSPYLNYMGIQNAKAILQGELPPTELGVTALNPTSLQITLHTANFQLPKMLAHLALLPTYQGKKPQPNQAFISNGYYKVRTHEKLLLLLEARFPEQRFQTVRYQLLTTVQNVDRFDLVENPLENYGRDIIHLPKLCNYFYEFNFEDPLLRKKEIRQAIRAMISPSEISRGIGIPIHSVLPKSLAVSDDHHPSSYSAEQLLHQLGFDAHNPLKLTLTHDNHGQHNIIANRMALTLSRSDLFRVQLQAVEWKQLLTKRQQHNFQLIRSGWCGDYSNPVLFLMPFHSTSPDNKSGYANPVVDKLLEQLQQTQTVKERERLITKIVQQLENDVAILPLFQYQRRLTIAPDIRGIDPNNSSEVIYSKDLYRQ